MSYQATVATQNATNVKGNNSMSTIALAITANNANTALQWFEPLVNGTSPREWMAWLMEKDAERADGSRYPAVYAVNGSAPYAVSQVTKTLWAAQKMGLLSYAQAIHQGKRFQSLAEAVTHSLSGQLRQAAPEITAATVNIRSKQQGSDAARDVKGEIKEALEEARQARVREEITEKELRTIAEYLMDELRSHEIRKISASEGLGESKDAVAADEGAIQTALHEVSDLWKYDPSDIRGAETLMVSALKHFGGVELPLDHMSWGPFLDRAAESLAVMVDYAEGEEAAKAQAKAEYRMAIAEHGIGHMPWKARWGVNYLTRRLWRDEKTLDRKIEQLVERMDAIREQMMREEKYNLPAKMTRVMSEFPVDSSAEPRRYYFIWEAVEESAFQPNELSHRDDRGTVSQLKQGEFELNTLDNAIRYAKEIKAQMTELYTELRKVEDAMRPIWKAMADGTMPAEPPVYWNLNGPYLNERDAFEALKEEWAQQDAQRKAAVVDGASKQLEEMLKAQGLMA